MINLRTQNPVLSLSFLYCLYALIVSSRASFALSRNIESDDDNVVVENGLHSKLREDDEFRSKINNNNVGNTSSGPNNENPSISSIQYPDDATLLDVFGEVAKDYLTHHLIPETDHNCAWSWKHARCEPFCECSFRPRFGDYHLGRSCRRRLQQGDNASPFTGNNYGRSGEDDHYIPEESTSQNNFDTWKRETCHLPPDSPYTKLLETSSTTAKHLGLRIKQILSETYGRADFKSNFENLHTTICQHIPNPMEQNGIAGEEYEAQMGQPKHRIKNLLKCSIK